MTEAEWKERALTREAELDELKDKFAEVSGVARVRLKVMHDAEPDPIRKAKIMSVLAGIPAALFSPKAFGCSCGKGPEAPGPQHGPRCSFKEWVVS